MAFDCQRCGECCSHMGLIHQVKEKKSADVYSIRNQYTGELTTVHVETDKAHLFNDRTTFLEFPEACPFFRRDPGTGMTHCTVHMTRPEICRDFTCWRFLIRTSVGENIGRVFYPRTLCSDDSHLKELWELQVRELRQSDPAWEKEMIRILTAAGYRVLS
jgi:Fe-S-cluster containining protein